MLCYITLRDVIEVLEGNIQTVMASVLKSQCLYCMLCSTCLWKMALRSTIRFASAVLEYQKETWNWIRIWFLAETWHIFMQWPNLGYDFFIACYFLFSIWIVYLFLQYLLDLLRIIKLWQVNKFWRCKTCILVLHSYVSLLTIF